MAVLVASLGEGKGTWSIVARLLRLEKWERAYIVCPSFAAKKFQPPENCEVVEIEEERPLKDIVESLAKRFEGKFFGDVAVNLASGSGKLHMALLSALLRAGAGIRLVEPGENGVEEV